MANDRYPDPHTDPAAAGIPEHADDDSDADPTPESSRQADGPAPSAQPLDREDPPVGLGQTPADERVGESLAERAWQEEPDTTADPEGEEPLDPVAEGAADPGLLSTTEAADTLPGTEEKVFESVGRLVQSDEGVPVDPDNAVLARDAGPSAGASSAEEAAMHTATEDVLDEGEHRPAGGG